MADEQKTDSTPTYTPEQQAHIQMLIDNRMAKVNSKHDELLTSLRDELAEAKKAKPAVAATPSTPNADGDSIETLKAQISELKHAGKDTSAENSRLKGQITKINGDLEKEKMRASDIQRDAAILQAAGKFNFYDPSEVADLTSKYVQYNPDHSKFVVVGENGTPRLNSAMEEMSLDEFYADYAHRKKHMVRGEIRPGTGASENRGTMKASYELPDIFGPKSNAKHAAELARTKPDEYKRLKADAQRQGLI